MKVLKLRMYAGIVCLVLFLCALIFSVGEKRSSAKGEALAGFTEISAVNGASFCINTALVNQATAVKQVNDANQIKENQFYSYQDEDGDFLFFNIGKLVVAAQKGTTFHINEAKDKEKALEAANLLNIRFSKGTTFLSSDTDDNITVTKVVANISVDSVVYGNYCGNLANINSGSEEWSMFVGVPGDNYNDLSSASQREIENIVDSFELCDSVEMVAEKMYAVSLNASKPEHEEVDIIKNEYKEENDIHLDNQKEIVNMEEDHAYSSSPFSMLKLGEKGVFCLPNELNKGVEGVDLLDEPIVCPVQVYRGEEAIEIIKKFCSDTHKYDYMECQGGCSWEVIEYSLNYKNCAYNDYINVSFKGLDGEPLKYRGIKYSPRTYDMHNLVKVNGEWEEHYFSYYAVPNGCYEYCIEFGDKDAYKYNDKVNDAYYDITNEKKADTTEVVTEVSTEDAN